ncbi:hypothetical protein LIER_40726 [Lithospermum erythrorhizon]|uniref:MORN repeat-containing protein n=1 Tax=Lithospermum erythrorhizon TaxID=34254 RepID=A0AAV3R2L9_LITER
MPESEMPISPEEPSSRIPESMMSNPAAICLSKSQANSSRRVTPTPTSEVIEKHLPNGDLYIGTFSGTAPHGSGHFKSGRMEGQGTFIGSDGDLYKGSWLGEESDVVGVGFGLFGCHCCRENEGKLEKKNGEFVGDYSWGMLLY